MTVEEIRERLDNLTFVNLHVTKIWVHKSYVSLDVDAREICFEDLMELKEGFSDKNIRDITVDLDQHYDDANLTVSFSV